MLNFSRWTPTLGVYFKWDSQKVLKIAHIGIFRHIGGVRWVRKITDIKILWVKVLHAKNGDFSTTWGWKINFFRQNIGMFDWLCTETYTIRRWKMLKQEREDSPSRGSAWPLLPSSSADSPSSPIAAFDIGESSALGAPLVNPDRLWPSRVVEFKFYDTSPPRKKRDHAEHVFLCA